MRLNPRVVQGVASPITEVYSWLNDIDPPPASLLDVAQAVPGYAPASELTEHVAAIAHDPAMSRYGPVLGMPELRAALAADIGAAYAAEMPENHVAITAGCNQAFCLAISALAEAGDEVILVVPYYFNHDMWLRMQGIVPRYLQPGPDFVPNAHAAADLITDRTRAMVLITPNNPTGAVTPGAELGAFADLCREHNVTLVLDETYRDFREDTAPPHRLFDRPDWSGHVVHLYSFSKVFSITGYRVGGMAASPLMLEQIDKLADCVTICPPLLSQHAALFGIRHLGGWVEKNRQVMVGRLREFRDAMANTTTRYEIAASGAYFAYLRHPFDEPARSVAKRLLHERHLLALPGDMFGPGQEHYLRVAFANVEDVTGIVERVGA